MKRISVIMLVFSILPLSCSHLKHGDNITVGDHVYSDEIEYLDSLRWLNPGPEYPDSCAVGKGDLDNVWDGFSKLYRSGKYEAAYKFLKEDRRYDLVMIYLRNTTAQFEFISKVWDECVAAYAETEEDYYDEIEEGYSFSLHMTKTVVEMGGDDPYVPPHYMNLVMDYGHLLVDMKDYEKAEAFGQEIYLAAKTMYGDERMATLLKLVYRCPILCSVGKESQAHEELEAFRQQAREECSGEELNLLLAAIDATESDMIQEE